MVDETLQKLLYNQADHHSLACGLFLEHVDENMRKIVLEQQRLHR